MEKEIPGLEKNVFSRQNKRGERGEGDERSGKDSCPSWPKPTYSRGISELGDESKMATLFANGLSVNNVPLESGDEKLDALTLERRRKGAEELNDLLAADCGGAYLEFDDIDPSILDRFNMSDVSRLRPDRPYYEAVHASGRAYPEDEGIPCISTTDAPRDYTPNPSYITMGDIFQDEAAVDLGRIRTESLPMFPVITVISVSKHHEVIDATAKDRVSAALIDAAREQGFEMRMGDRSVCRFVDDYERMEPSVRQSLSTSMFGVSNVSTHNLKHYMNGVVASSAMIPLHCRWCQINTRLLTQWLYHYGLSIPPEPQAIHAFIYNYNNIVEYGLRVRRNLHEKYIEEDRRSMGVFQRAILGVFAAALDSPGSALRIMGVPLTSLRLCLGGGYSDAIDIAMERMVRFVGIDKELLLPRISRAHHKDLVQNDKRKRPPDTPVLDMSKMDPRHLELYRLFKRAKSINQDMEFDPNQFMSELLESRNRQSSSDDEDPHIKEERKRIEQEEIEKIRSHITYDPDRKQNYYVPVWLLPLLMSFLPEPYATLNPDTIRLGLDIGNQIRNEQRRVAETHSDYLQTPRDFDLRHGHLHTTARLLEESLTFYAKHIQNTVTVVKNHVSRNTQALHVNTQKILFLDSTIRRSHAAESKRISAMEEEISAIRKFAMHNTVVSQSRQIAQLKKETSDLHAKNNLLIDKVEKLASVVESCIRNSRNASHSHTHFSHPIDPTNPTLFRYNESQHKSVRKQKERRKLHKTPK